MEATRRTQAAFITPDGRHVLVQIDRDDDIGLIDPDSLISWIFLNRRDLDIWPLAPLNQSGDPS
ncbi:hypothetical protein [Microbacterium telephonicum]|nr:hypothetical protein [Microbacterium telephonicum]